MMMPSNPQKLSDKPAMMASERATRYAVGGAPIEIPIAVKIDDGLIDRW